MRVLEKKESFLLFFRCCCALFEKMSYVESVKKIVLTEKEKLDVCCLTLVIM